MEDNRSQSEFNMAVSYLNRLNALLYTADEAAMSLDVYTWFHSLMTLYRELSTEMKNSEIEKFKESIEILEPKIQITLNEQERGRTNVDQEVYRLLHDFEIRLRRILKDSGLQMKMQEDASKALR
jgi:Cdc6-like AAA superfamily ATPase